MSQRPKLSSSHVSFSGSKEPRLVRNAVQPTSLKPTTTSVRSGAGPGPQDQSSSEPRYVGSQRMWEIARAVVTAARAKLEAAPEDLDKLLCEHVMERFQDMDVRARFGSDLVQRFVFFKLRSRVRRRDKHAAHLVPTPGLPVTAAEAEQMAVEIYDRLVTRVLALRDHATQSVRARSVVAPEPPTSQARPKPPCIKRSPHRRAPSVSLVA